MLYHGNQQSVTICQLDWTNTQQISKAQFQVCLHMINRYVSKLREGKRLSRSQVTPTNRLMVRQNKKWREERSLSIFQEFQSSQVGAFFAGIAAGCHLQFLQPSALDPHQGLSRELAALPLCTAATSSTPLVLQLLSSQICYLILWLSLWILLPLML